MYKYMVGDTVRVVGRDVIKKMFSVRVKKPFIIKEATQMLATDYEPSEGKYKTYWEPHYKGLIKNLGNYAHDEDEIFTSRMVLTEKKIIFS